MKHAASKIVLAALLVLPVLAQATPPAPTLLVVPARQVMIQLAFDMQSLRGAEVVSWSNTADADSPVLNYWTGKNWSPITLEQFRKNSYLKNRPQKVVFLGLEPPGALTDSELPGIARFETYDPAMLVNNLDAFYAFSDGEWRLLSRRYGFILRDTNARIREQNRYNRPPPAEVKSPRRPPVKFEKNPPPAEVIEPRPAPAKSADSETVKPDAAPSN